MSKPLQGIKILDMTRVLAGPYCTMMLANMGAEVIKCEMPGLGDDSRAFGPHVNGESGYFLSINRGKKSIVLDMKSDEGKQIFRTLLTQVDVITENYKPGTMEKLGFGYEEIKKINPSIIYTAMSGFGHTGPYSDRPAYDMIVQGMGGIISITGEPGKDPVRVGASIGDIVAGMYGAYGTLAALYNRRDTGEGQKVDIAMFDCQLSILENAIAKTSISGKAPGPLGLKHPSISPFESYRTKDSRIIIAAGNDKLFGLFCKVTGNEELIEDERFSTNMERAKRMHELTDLFQPKMLEKTTDEWMEICLAKGIPAGPINTIDKLFTDPQVAQRNMLVEVDQPKMGKVKIAGNPVKMSSIAVEDEIPAGHAPLHGEHTAEILSTMVGYSKEQVEEYLKKYDK